MTRTVFLGSKQLGLRSLQTIHEIDPRSLAGIVTFDDRSDTRSTFDELLAFARSASLPIRVAQDRLDAERAVREWWPDICLVVGWYWLISKATLDSVPRGFLGIHNSQLPRYRGGAPVVWAMIQGETEIGFTLFSFSEGVDDGPIWGQGSVPVGPEDYVSDVLEKIDKAAVALLRDRWPAIVGDAIAPVAQDESQATYCALRTPDDGRIDWRASAANVARFVRAQSKPYPGAFALIDGNEKLTIWKARAVEIQFYGTRGQVAQIRPDGVYVICGDHRPLLVETVGLGCSDELLPARDVLKSLKTRLR
jgi:methionyl-tRNA formyltransferase